MSEEQLLWRSWNTQTRAACKAQDRKGSKGTGGDHPKLLRQYVNHHITDTYDRPPTHPKLVKAEREQAPALEEGRLV